MPLSFVYREKHEVVSELVEVVCNPCGKAAAADSLGSYPYGFHTIVLSGGYGDHFPGDTETFQIVVCEDCLRKWVESFVHKDLSQGNAFGFRPSYKVRHSTSGLYLVFDRCWLRGEGETIPNGLRDPIMPEDYPESGVWEHFKGNRYEVLDLAWDVHTQEPHVIYRALYGQSEIWARPLVEWTQVIERDGYSGPRFKRLP